jgi:hypothetical protein
MSKVSSLVRLAGLALLLAVFLALEPAAQGQTSRRWGLHRAYTDLRVVHRDLKTLKKGAYGGHRVKAIHHIDLALGHLRAAAKHYYKGKVPEGVLTAKLPPAPKKTSFRKLFEDTHKAHRDLKAIKPGNYGGHRHKAVVELDKALVEMKKGVAHAEGK